MRRFLEHSWFKRAKTKAVEPLGDPQPIENLRHGSQRPAQWTGKYPPEGPADWIADGHVTCNVQCSGGKCDRRMVNVRLDTLPQGLPWSTIGPRLACKECGVAGSVHIVPNWHDKTKHVRAVHEATGKRETSLCGSSRINSPRRRQA